MPQGGTRHISEENSNRVCGKHADHSVYLPSDDAKVGGKGREGEGRKRGGMLEL